jgi:hypothetical protein
MGRESRTSIEKFFVSPITFWETTPKIAPSYSKGPNNFYEIGHDWYQKTQNFMLVSKIQTYQGDKMHIKKVISKIPAIFGVSSNLACYFVIIFLGAFSKLPLLYTA